MVSTRKERPEWHPWPADAPFLSGVEPPLLLRLKIKDLLASEKTRTIVEDRLRQVLFGAASGKNDRVPIESPFIFTDAYSVTLFATSSGRNGLPKEVPVSASTNPSEEVLKGRDLLDLELLPENLALVAADRGEAVRPRDCFLRITGSMKARFERTQYEANFDVLRTAVTDLQHHLSSLTPSSRQAPEVFVQVPQGGNVASETNITTVMSQYLVGTISVRQGSADKDYAAVQELASRFLGQLRTQINFHDLDDSKRVAVLMSNNATLSATVGDIKELASQTKEQREKQLDIAMEEAENRRSRAKHGFKGKIGIDYSEGGGVLSLGSLAMRVAGQVSGEMTKKIEDERANQRNQQLATLNRDLDELGKFFKGQLPTLTGIRFDQKGLDETFKTLKGQFEKKEFTVGPSQVSWPVVRLGSPGPETLGAKFLADELARTRLQYKELHDQHEAFKKSIASTERFADLEKSAQEARELAAKLQASLARVDRLEKEVGALKLETPALLTWPGGHYNSHLFIVNICTWAGFVHQACRRSSPCSSLLSWNALFSNLRLLLWPMPPSSMPLTLPFSTTSSKNMPPLNMKTRLLSQLWWS
jgi:hypothetical protein